MMATRPARVHTERPATPLTDRRFRELLGPLPWRQLPSAIRRRFSHQIPTGASMVYCGQVLETRLSKFGWLLAQAGRVLDGPLPLENQTDTPSVVTVTDDPAGGGQLWTRQYGRATGFAQVIQSAKRFAGPTGLEEHIGGGVGMALTLQAKPDRLVFTSDHFFVCLFGRRIRLPHWLVPLSIRVEHINRNDCEFLFELRVEHHWIGQLLNQCAVYQEMPADPRYG